MVDLTETRKFVEVRKGFTPFRDDDIIFAKITPCMENGKIAILSGLRNGVGFGSTEFHVIRLPKELPRKYVFFYLVQEGFRKNAERNMTGSVGQRRVPTDYLKEAIIPLPPLPEQHRIVNKIEELFTQLDAGVDLLQKTKVLLNQYRQSVLKSAFEGKLTEEWRKKTKALDWQLFAIDHLSRKVTDGEHIRPNIQGKGIPFLSAKNVRDNGVDFEECLFVSNSDAQKFRKRCDPEKGDLLIVSRGATVGRSCAVDTDQQFCLLGSVILIKPHSRINSSFLSYILKSPQVKKRLINLSGSTAQQAIYIRDIKSLKIPLPSSTEQDLIVDLLDRHTSNIAKTEAEVARALSICSSLKSSILAKAFQGKLVPQDPADEPASRLLERLKAQRSGEPPRGRKPRQTKMF